MIHYHVLLAHISHQQGDKMAAHEALRAALDLAPTGKFSLQALQIHQALLYLRQGEAVTAERLLRQISAYPLPAHLAGDGLLRVAWAELFLAQQQYPAAEALLTSIDEARWDPFLSILPQPNLLLALAYWGQHKVNQAHQEMLRAIRLAEPEGIIRPFLDCGFSLIPVLTFVLHAGKLSRVQHDFVTLLFNHLRTAYPETPVPSPTEVAAWFVSAQISPREQEILRLLDEGLDNQALAAHLMVTDSTVRTHLRHIYRKLGVNTRIQALKRARELQLLRSFDL
jgi:LuxR family maltose regulon positive regulatory protein